MEGKHSLKRETTGEVYRERSVSATALLSVVVGPEFAQFSVSRQDSKVAEEYDIGRRRSTDRSSVSRSTASSEGKVSGSFFRGAQC